jgi:hypothetical protein
MMPLLVCLPDFDYTPAMQSIDPKWTHLAAGYQAIQSYKTKLTAEFGRAVEVGHKHQFRKELTEWQKKRRVFFTLVAAAPLSIIALCLTAYYVRDVACVTIYWAVLVLIILVTLAVAGRQYFRQMISGKPVPQPLGALVVDLEGRWWESLPRQDLVSQKVVKKDQENFLNLLARSIPDPYFAQVLSETDVMLFGPSVIWLFKVVPWGGTIVKQDGTWKQIEIMRDRLVRKRREETLHQPGPDDQWLQWKQEIASSLEEHLPARAWTLGLIQGGVVFSHPKVTLDKKHIQGNTASFGTSKAWIERVRRRPLVEGFPLEMQLEILDFLAGERGQPPASAQDLADLLYQQAVEELHAYVEKLVK